MTGIMVLVEHRRGEVREISLEMLKKAQELAESTGQEVEGVVIGDPPQAVLERVRPHCHRLLWAKVEGLKEFHSEPYQQVLTQLLRERRPRVILMGHTSQGMDLAPALGAALDLPVLTDCYGFGFRDGVQWGHRQMYGGKLSAEVIAEAESVVVTVRSGSFDPQGLKELPGQVQEVSVQVQPYPYKQFLGFIEAPKAEVDITQAEVVVSVGRGIGGPENIPMAEELAKALGGVLACSRPVVDKGWLPKERQVGTSGKTVKPKVYIALGISGAFQHVAGMKQSGLIIAVNKDPKAPIFNVAHYGIVGDVLQVIPVLMNKLKERKR